MRMIAHHSTHGNRFKIYMHIQRDGLNTYYVVDGLHLHATYCADERSAAEVLIEKLNQVGAIDDWYGVSNTKVIRFLPEPDLNETASAIAQVGIAGGEVARQRFGESVALLRAFNGRGRALEIYDKYAIHYGKYRGVPSADIPDFIADILKETARFARVSGVLRMGRRWKMREAIREWWPIPEFQKYVALHGETRPYLSRARRVPLGPDIPTRGV